MFLALGFAPASPAFAQSISQVNTAYSSSTAVLILDAYAAKYAVDMADFVATAKCESGFSEHALNPTDGRGGSRGVFQFQTATFEKYKLLAGLPNAEIWNPYDNIQVAAYMFSIGEQHQWTCFRLAHAPPSHG